MKQVKINYHLGFERKPLSSSRWRICRPCLWRAIIIFMKILMDSRFLLSRSWAPDEVLHLLDDIGRNLPNLYRPQLTQLNGMDLMRKICCIDRVESQFPLLPLHLWQRAESECTIVLHEVLSSINESIGRFTFARSRAILFSPLRTNGQQSGREGEGRNLTPTCVLVTLYEQKIH